MQAPPSLPPAEAVTVPELPPDPPPVLPVLYRDEAVVAVHKPSGLLVHRTGLDAGERWFAVQLLRDQLGGQHVYPVHRLDKATSGVLLFALSSADAATLGAQFSGQDPARPVGKRYEAVVRGWPPASGTIDYPLTQDDKPAQPAVTHYRTLATLELPLRADRYPHSRYARVELLPVTGRTHQLRRHFAHLRHPLVGDTTHGVGAHNRLWREHCGCQRLLLACTRLAVAHPRTGAPLVIEAAPDASFEAAWAAALALAVPPTPVEPMAHPLSPPSGTMAP